MLDGFDVSAVLTVEELEEAIRTAKPSDTPLDCIILDHQAEATADGIARFLDSLRSPALQDTKLIHLYTPVTDTISSNPVFGGNTFGIIRMTKPPRKARLLQALAKLRKLPPETYAALRSAVTLTVEEPPESQRTLFGNVLIAEGKCQNNYAIWRQPHGVVVQTTQSLRNCSSSSYNAMTWMWLLPQMGKKPSQVTDSSHRVLHSSHYLALRMGTARAWLF
jgi:hypothetical protein